MLSPYSASFSLTAPSPSKIMLCICLFIMSPTLHCKLHEGKDSIHLQPSIPSDWSSSWHILGAQQIFPKWMTEMFMIKMQKAFKQKWNANKAFWRTGPVVDFCFGICPFFPNLQEAAGSLALQTSLSPMVWFDRLSGGTDGYTELQAYSSRFLKWQ